MQRRKFVKLTALGTVGAMLPRTKEAKAMSKEIDWTKEAYIKSYTSAVWWYTPYDKNSGGFWKFASKDNPLAKELQEIYKMEMALGEVPEWAVKFIGWVMFMAPCGGYRFPEPLLRIASAIGSASKSKIEKMVEPRCYTVQAERKREALDYCLCLDGWLQNADPSMVAAELNHSAFRKRKWDRVCTEMWKILGERNETKELLVDHYLTAIRHAVKSASWLEDRGTEFMRGQYLGAFKLTNDGSVEYRDRHQMQHEKEVKKRLFELWPEWPSFTKVDFGHWWLCAPKAFRFLERDLVAIGQLRPVSKTESVPEYLDCRDTYPSQDDAAKWFRQYHKALDGWWTGKRKKGKVADDVNRRLGKPAPVKKWLVRLHSHKLRLLMDNGEEFASLVIADHKHKRGTRPLLQYVNERSTHRAD